MNSLFQNLENIFHRFGINLTNYYLLLMWREEKNRLQATFKFKDFMEAFAFMTEVAFHAEKLNHHPNWSNVWNSVEIQLTTHDSGNIVTEKDRALAKIIDGIYQRFSA